jgi:exopolysaccharide production protein ExoQ
VLFWLDREPEVRTSGALWIPVMWLLINGSRPISQWLQLGAPITSADQYMEGSPVDAAGFAILLAAGILVSARRWRQVWELMRSNAPVLLFFGYCAVSILWSDYPDISLKRWVKGLGDLVMVIIVLTDIDPSAAMRRLLSRAGFILLPLSVLLIKYYPALGRVYNGGDTIDSPWVPLWTGVTTTKNYLGMITLLFGLGAVWQVLEALKHKEMEHRYRHLLAQSVLLATALWLFSMANSMTSQSCFLLASVLLVTSGLGVCIRNPWIVHLLVVGIVGVSCAVLLSSVGGGALEAMGRNPTLTGRTDIWKVVLSFSGSPLVGTGFESFWLGERMRKMWNIYAFHLNEAHNGYLEVYLNLGWAGIVFLGVVIATGYRNVFTALRNDPYIGGMRLAYFVMILVYNLTESAFRLLTPVWFFFLLAAVNPVEATSTEESGELDSDLGEVRGEWVSHAGIAPNLAVLQENS